MMHVQFKRWLKSNISSQLLVKNVIVSGEYHLNVKNDLKVANLATEVTGQNPNKFSSS